MEGPRLELAEVAAAPGPRVPHQQRGGEVRDRARRGLQQRQRGL